jgi:hypothetical protein
VHKQSRNYAKNELWKRLFTADAIVSQKWQMKISFARKQFHHLVCVPVAWSPVRMEGNLLASEDRVLGEISGPRAGWDGVQQHLRLSACLVLRRRIASLYKDHIDLFTCLTKIYTQGAI